MEDTTSAISAIAAGLESSSATTDASPASTGDTSTDSGASSTGDPNPTGAVDIPSGDPAAEVAAPEVAPEVAEETTQDPNEPQGHMPLHRHKAVLTKARREFEAKELAFKQQMESLQWAQAPGITDKLQALDIAEADPDRFIQVLKQDPRYAKLLTPAEQPAQPAAPAAPAYGERPGPDRQDAEGNLYYSQEQTAALQEWVEQANEAKVQALLDKRFAPLEAERKAQAERQQQEQMWGQAIERQKSILTDARATWPLFSEVENTIKADLAKNPTMTLETAYRRAFTPRAQANRDEMRKSILAELNNRPPVAASTRPGAAPVKSAAPLDNEAAIMAIAQSLERAG